MSDTKHFLALIAAALIMFAPVAAASSPPTVDMRWAMQSAVKVNITAIVMNPVGVFIRVGNGGSGTAVYTAGGMTRILTAAHVCDFEGNFKIATVTTHGGNKFVGEVVAFDNVVDLCIIDVIGTIRTIDIAHAMPDIGSVCAIVGAPGRWNGSQAWPTHDTITLNGPTSSPLGTPSYEIVWEGTADLVGGWSGAGVICGSRVVGMIFAIDTTIGELAYLIEVDYLRSFLAKHDARSAWRKK